MTAHRIKIIGASGVGKTTLARALADRLGIPHFDADDYYHLPTDPPYQVQREPAERRALIERDLGAHASWTLSGGAGTWVPTPTLDYTAIVFVSLPADVRLERLRRREHELYGARILPGGDMESDHRAFMEWTKGYDASTSYGTNTLEAHEAFLERAKCPIIRLAQPVSLDDAIAVVLENLPK